MSKTYDIIQGRTSQITHMSYDLNGLARAFARTGNATVAEELHGLADEMGKASQEILEAYRDERMVAVDQSIANSNRFIGSMLTGLVAGKDPKDACLGAVGHHLDRDLIDARG